MNNNNNKAFSLIELSIVLIIIGLLVAGITGGQSLIESAKIRGFANEINSYRQAYNSFIALNNKIPGDRNGSGKIGLYSGQTYDNRSFPAPYDVNNNEYKIPNELSAPFVDLYLAKIIDFKPTETNSASYKESLGLPLSKYVKAVYYFEYGHAANNSESTDKKNYKYMISPGNKITANKAKNFSINPKYFKNYDEKYDDGIYNNGIIRGNCGSVTYDAAILQNKKCSTIITSLELI